IQKLSEMLRSRRFRKLLMHATITLLTPRFPRLKHLKCPVITCNVRPPVRYDVYVVQVPRVPSVKYVEPTVAVELQVERSVERLTCMIHVNALDMDVDFPNITQVNVNRVGCMVKPYVFSRDPLAHGFS